MASRAARVLLTPGEPGGIGPDLCLAIAASNAWPANTATTLVADPSMLAQRAARLNLDVDIVTVDAPVSPVSAAPAATDSGHEPAESQAAPYRGRLHVLPVSIPSKAQPGVANPAHAPYVLACLDRARQAINDGVADALCTGPIQKSSINAAGIAFSGHTEYLAAPYGAHPIMMLAGPSLRVTLVTTHLPLRDVPAQITTARVLETIRIVHHDLKLHFGIDQPRLCVTGLNPHAGESGHLGHEDDAQIAPAVAQARAAGIDITGPLPADTAMAAPTRQRTDAYICMYHDQGLPVVKALDFGRVVNITLGLPIIRTSVDHGTALDLAGTGRADPSSLLEALTVASHMAHTHLARAANTDLAAAASAAEQSA